MDESSSPIYATMTNPSMVDFPGRLAAVMFTTGCTFRCGFCHNAALLGQPRQGYSWDKLEAICEHFRRQWVSAVVITGGEPTLASNLLQTIRFFKARGFEVKLDSNGSRPEVLRDALPLVDYVAMDIKCALERYADFVQFRDTAAIARSVALLKETDTRCEFRTTLIEGIHTDEEMQRMGSWIEGAALYTIQAFIPRDDLPDPDLRSKARTSPGALEHAAEVMRDYVGNVAIRGG